MIKKVFLFAIIAILFLGVGNLHAQKVDIDSSSGVVPLDGESLGIGNPDFTDSFVVSSFALGGVVSVISSTTPYTILSLAFFTSSDYGAYLRCGDDPLIPFVFDRFDAEVGAFGRSYDVQLHCSDDLLFFAPDFGAIEVQYVPYDTRVRSGGTLDDIVFGLGIIIVIMFLAVCGFVFNKVIGRKKW